MIPRYQTKEMAEIWAEHRKFMLWLKIELAVLRARAACGELPTEQVDRIAGDAQFDLQRIAEIEADTQHDLLAFVQSVREYLHEKDKSEFHRKMTSYDTEEIPTNIRLKESIAILRDEIHELEIVILEQARRYKATLQIGRTHGQQAEPITFGFKLLGWLSNFQRDSRRLQLASEQVSVGKISGAVGVYGELDPRVEALVCKELGLRPASHSTQILHRDRIAELVTKLAILAGNIEHVANDFRLMAQTEVCEVREPFGKKQKGSSRMPHKKNTIITERLCGLARLIRGYTVSALEDITTWGERDISQSSVERVMLPDCFHLLHYMLQKLTYVLKEMEVFPGNMRRNLELTQGCIYSGRIKDLLLSWGMEPEAAYRLVQEQSFCAMSDHKPLVELIAWHDDFQPLIAVDKNPRLEALYACVDPWHELTHLPEIFGRFGINFDGKEETKTEEVMKQP